MIQNQRVILVSGATNTDVSVALDDFRGTPVEIPLVASQDYLYVATDLPFNHKYFKILTPNAETSVVKVDIWFSRAWVPAVDVIDTTSIAGVSLAQSGIIQWGTDRLKGWDVELDSDDVTGISIKGIYSKFWARFYWDTTLSNDTEMTYLGHRFSSDTELYSFYPDLNNDALKTTFATGKTTWDDQAFIAAGAIERDLKAKGIALSPNQILNWQIFSEASVHKVAEIIYSGLGRAYEENRKNAKAYYAEALGLTYFEIDQNKTGMIEDNERATGTGWLNR